MGELRFLLQHERHERRERPPAAAAACSVALWGGAADRHTGQRSTSGARTVPHRSRKGLDPAWRRKAEALHRQYLKPTSERSYAPHGPGGS
jgi:hypothetical protein